MKVAGVIFIVLSAGSVGIRIGITLRQKCRYLQDMLLALRALEREISFGSLILPDALHLAANVSGGEIKRIFHAVGTQLAQNPWTSPKHALEMQLPQHHDQPEELLLQLFEQIGKYDLQIQLESLRLSIHQAEQLLQDLTKERSIKSGTYETLSICAGLAAAILLV